MGNRDDLLTGAKECLYEKGYANTTARDIAAASGVSLAAIGYHFGSKDALMNEALYEAIREWGEELGRVLGAGPDPDATPEQRFTARWNAIIDSVSAHPRIWATQYELIALAEHSPEMRELFTKGNRAARLGLAEIFLDLDPGTDDPRTLALGTFYQTLLTGVIAQWLTDPTTAPSGDDLVAALRGVTASLGPA